MYDNDNFATARDFYNPVHCGDHDGFCFGEHVGFTQETAILRGETPPRVKVGANANPRLRRHPKYCKAFRAAFPAGVAAGRELARQQEILRQEAEFDAECDAVRLVEA